jgi:hypothetical protein
VNREVIVATMWTGPQMVSAVDPAAPPTQADLDAIADELTPGNCGVRPTVRVVEEFAIPPYEDSAEPTCEQWQEQSAGRGPYLLSR